MTVTPKVLSQTSIPSRRGIFHNNTSLYSLSVPLGDNRFLLVYKDGTSGVTGLFCKVGTINSNGSFTYGDAFQFGTTSTSSDALSVCLIDSTRVLIVFSNAAQSNYVYAVVATIDGNNVSFGTLFQVYTVGATYIDCCYIGNNFYAIAFSGSSSYAQTAIVSITGTTISLARSTITLYGGTSTFINVTPLSNLRYIVTFAAGATLYSYLCIFDGTNSISSFSSSYSASSPAYIDSAKIDDNNVLIVYTNSNNGLYGVILNINGTAMTYGTAVTLDAITVVNRINITAMVGGLFVAAYRNSTENSLRAVAVQVNGSSISVGNVYKFSNLTNNTTYYLYITSLSNTLAVINVNTNNYSYNVALSVNGMQLSESLFFETIVSNSQEHTEVVSLYTVYTGGSGSAIVTLFLNDIPIRKFTISPDSEFVINLANCPIILRGSDTLKAYVDNSTQGQVNITAIGLEVAA
jgi:hypothetical protein